MERLKLTEVEFNFSNLCTHDCFICSKYHGCGNVSLMNPHVFYQLIEDLKDIDFNMVQTSGNGDAFLNEHFLEYLSVIRKTFPKVRICFYSNFSIFDQEKSDRIINENLINRVYVRIDSLDPNIANRVTGRPTHGQVLKNIEYFMSKNSKIEFEIMYSNIPGYYKRCWEVLGKRPIHSPFSDSEINVIPDEYAKIKKFFGNKPFYTRMGHSLWAERIQAKVDLETQCPKLGLFENIIWLHPNGLVGVCGYDDQQSVFIGGNAMAKSISEIWMSKERRDIINMIRDKKYREYPCIDPKCCSMKFYDNNS